MNSPMDAFVHMNELLFKENEFSQYLKSHGLDLAHAQKLMRNASIKVLANKFNWTVLSNKTNQIL